jgi:hypothetical protein
MGRYHRVCHSYLADGLADRARPLPAQGRRGPRESLREIARITRQRHGDAKELAVAGKLEVDTGLDDRLPE